MRRCVYRKQLDLETLVCTRGPNFPLGRLEGRLMCPACGNRRVTVVFEPPSNTAQMVRWVTRSRHYATHKPIHRNTVESSLCFRF